MKDYRFFYLTLLIVLIDQASKLLVHHYMYLHEEVNVIGDWFRLHYLLNPGMAFGFRWENAFGKLLLTLFRICAMCGIGYYMIRVIRQNGSSGFLWCLALILGGAIGNVIDSTFYGVFLHNNPIDAPTPWFHGQVIDMLYFPILEFNIPDWFPFHSGDTFLFFSPVFNIADSSIFIGVVLILIYQRKFFGKHKKAEENIPAPTPVETSESGPQSSQSQSTAGDQPL